MPASATAATTVADLRGQDRRRRLAWAAAGVIAAAVTSWAMYEEIAAFRHPTTILAGQDFFNNTWRAWRALLSGANIYGPTNAVIPSVEPAWPVAQHVPASLFWQAPFAALPIPVALFAFTLASILAIWAGVFLLTRPAAPWAVLATAGCGAFAILVGGGPETLLLGQPTGFMLLGLAILVRARSPWVAGAGFMVAATTLQTGLPLALAMLVLSGWPILSRGIVLIATCSALPVALEVANAGLRGFVTSFISGAAYHLGRRSNRVDLAALLRALGVTSVAIQAVAGLALVGVCLAYLARLPRPARRLDNPPVLCVVIAMTVLCTYAQFYEMLLVGGCIVPLIVVVDRSWAMLPSLGLAAIGATLAIYGIRDIASPLCLLAVTAGSAYAATTAARRAAAPLVLSASR